MREDATRTGKEFDEIGRQITRAFNSTRNAAIGLFTVFTAGQGISAFVRNTTEGSAALGRMSRDLQISTRDLSAWEGVSRRAGNSLGEVTSAFSGIQQQIQNFRLYGNPLSPTFRALNIALADATTGQARSTEEIYADVLDRLAARRPQERLALAQGLGLGQETVNLAGLPLAQRQAMLQQQRTLGVTTPEEAARAQQLREAWLNLEQALTTTGRRLLHDLTPGIMAVLEQFRNFAVFLAGPDFEEGRLALTRWVQDFARYLGSPEFADAMRSLASGIVAVAEAIVEALRWLGLIARPAQQQGPTITGQPMGGPSTLPPGPRGGPAAGGVWPWITGLTPEQREEARQRREAERARGGAAAPAGASEAQRIAYQSFISRGWTPAQAAGIVGHLSGESGRGLDPNAFNPAGGGRGAMGIGQWRGPRIAAFEARYGRSPQGAPLEQQLEFVDWELRNTERAAGEAIRTARDPSEAAEIAFRRYGRPERGDPTGPRRAATAAGLLNELGPNGRPVPAPAAPPDPNIITRPGQGASLSSTSSYSTSEANIGAITINTQATNAEGIARELAPALRRYAFVEQAATGLV